METKWIIVFSLLIVGQFFTNLFFILLIGALSRKVDLYWKAMEEMAKISDGNFSRTAGFLDEIAKFLVKVFGLDVPKMQQVDKISPPSSGLKN